MKNADYLFFLRERVIRILHFAERQRSNSSSIIKNVSEAILHSSFN